MMKTQNMQKIGAGVVGGTLVTGVSNAALPTAAAGAFSSLSTDVLALVDLAWTAAIPITVAFIVLKLFKKAASSAV